MGMTIATSIYLFFQKANDQPIWKEEELEETEERGAKFKSPMSILCSQRFRKEIVGMGAGLGLFTGRSFKQVSVPDFGRL